MDWNKMSQIYHIDFSVTDLEFYQKVIVYLHLLHSIQAIDTEHYQDRVFTVFKRVANLIEGKIYDRTTLTRTTAVYFLNQLYKKRKWITDEEASEFQKIIQEIPEVSSNQTLKEAEEKYLSIIRKEMVTDEANQ